MTFKESFRDFQELAREHKVLRDHNLSIKPGNPQDKLLLFAEGALVLMILERFLRILPGVEATDKDTLYNLLDKATSASRQVLVISPRDREFMLGIRNAVLHGNFEQAARRANMGSKEEYFKKKYDLEIEELYKMVDGLVDQIDPNTGLRKVPIQ